MCLVFEHFFHNVLFWGVQQCFPSRCRLPLTTWPCFPRATPWHISRQRDFPHMLSRRQVSDSAGERIKCVPKLSPNRQRSVALEPFAPDHMCSGAREKGADGTPSSCRGLPEGTVRAASGVDNLCSLMRYLHDVWSASDFGYASHARTPWEDTVATLKSSKHKQGLDENSRKEERYSPKNPLNTHTRCEFHFLVTRKPNEPCWQLAGIAATAAAGPPAPPPPNSAVNGTVWLN